MAKKQKKKRYDGRIDFIAKVDSLEDKGNLVSYSVILEPDPKRYEKIQLNGEVAYKDKFTNVVFSQKVLEQAFNESQELPIFYSPQLEKICSYLKRVKAELSANWDKDYELRETRIPAQEYLEELVGKETRIVTLYVDLEGSTRISSTQKAKTNVKLKKIFLMQMAMVIKNFRGNVHNFAGDCVIGIFLADVNDLNMCDNAIKAAITMRNVVEDIINPMFIEYGLPEIGFHIGLDIGLVNVANIGAIDIAALTDLIGYSMDLTAKIKSQAKHNEILMGRRAYKLSHVSLQQLCQKVDLGQDWNMKDPDDNKHIYDIYRCNGKWNC